MPSISVNKSKFLTAETELNEAIKKIHSIKSSFDSVSRSLDWEIKGQAGVNSRINRISNDLEAEITAIEKMEGYLEIACNRYFSVENDIISGKSKKNNESIGAAFDSWWTGQISTGYDYSSYSYYDESRNKYIYNNHKTMKTSFDAGESLKFEDKDAIYTLKPEDKRDIASDELMENKLVGSVIEAKVGGNVEYSFLENNYEVKGDYGSGRVSAKIGTCEAHYGAGAGLYVYEVGPDGAERKVFSPGVKAEAGVSAALLDVEADGRVGLGKDNNLLGVYGKTSAEGIRGEAKAKAAINSQEIFLGGSAEADLVKVTGTAGVSVLGTDVGLTASAKVGVGAHLNFGLEDGKIKADIGAALGVGIDVGFELDAGGAIAGISEFAGWLFKN